MSIYYIHIQKYYIYIITYLNNIFQKKNKYIIPNEIYITYYYSIYASHLLKRLYIYIMEKNTMYNIYYIEYTL